MPVTVSNLIEPATYDVPAMIHGTNYEFGFIIWLDREEGEVKDLTGCVVEIDLLDNTGVIGTLTAGEGLTIYPTDGAVLIKLDDSDVSTYPLGELIYRLNVTELSGEIHRYIEGRIPVRE